MASGGTNLSTRMPAGDQSIVIIKTARDYFKQHKVDISYAIKTTFPFLEILRDRGFITKKMYNECKKSGENLSPVQKVVYNVLDKLEEKFNLSLLETLFCKAIMETYPDLNDTLKGFRDAILEKICQKASGGEESAENRNTQLSLQQGTNKNLYQSLTWLYPDPSNHDGPAPPEYGLLEHFCETEQINVRETDTTSDNNSALESQQANEQCAQESEPAGVELPNHGNQFNSCSVHPVNIKKEKPSSSSRADWEAQGRTDCNQAPDITVISSEDSAEFNNGDEVPEASTSAGKRKIESLDLRKSPTSGKKLCKKKGSLEGSSGFNAEKKPPGAWSCALRCDPDEAGTVALGNDSTLEKAKRKRRIRKHEDESVNFDAEILPVTCGEIKGMLYVKKLEQGAIRKCIQSEDGNWFTPREFEIKGGYQRSSDWKTSVRCGGKTLRWLMKEGKLPTPPRTYGRKTKLGNSDVCEICWDGGKLFCCITCSRSFHEDCHIPPVETERSPWSCTFCRMESSGSQQRLRESEVPVRPMGPEEQLKCEFLLLKFYCHSEDIFSEMILCGDYRTETSQHTKHLKMLNEIKKKLSVRGYRSVGGFMQDMHRIFQDYRASNKCNDDLYLMGTRLEEKFEQNFKEVFGVQKIKQEHTDNKIKLENNA